MGFMGRFTPNGNRPKPPALFPLRHFYRELTALFEGNGRGLCLFRPERMPHIALRRQPGSG